MPAVQLRRILTPLVVVALGACGGDSGTEPAPVAGIDVDPTSISITVGESATITATPRDASGNPLADRTVTFTSGDQSVASVTSAGVVTGEGEGSTVITVTSEGQSAQVAVTVAPAPVASVELSPSSLDLVVGESATLTVTLRDAQGNALTGRSVTFSSQDETVATVDQNGEVTAQSVGQTTVTATSEGQSGQAAVDVTPVPVASVEIDPADLDLVVGQQQALTVTLRDADGNELTGREVTFESDDDAVATVDDQGVVQGVAPGSATITATSEGESATAHVDVTAPPFEPTEDTEVDGDREWASISIPAGVTVTVTSGAVLHSLGEVTIAGAVMADCHEIQLIADGPITVTGTMDNRCTSDPTADGDQLRIVGTGAMTFTGSTVTSSGDLTVSNDSTLTLDDFQAARAMGVPLRPLRLAASGPCSYSGINSPDRPKPPTPETSGKSGANGTNARTKRFICDGDFDFDGGSVDGYDAGDAEDGTAGGSDDSQGPAEGGDGGDAGELRVLASGSITFRGGAVIHLGNGGKGGDAERIAPPNRSAEAIGGIGGMSGTLTVQAGGGITIPPAGLTIDIGAPGAGGNANAVGGKGDDSTPTEAAKDGGNATATGGKGGSTPAARFRSSGNVSGLGNISLTGGPVGAGGTASATGGQGGHGAAKENPDGAEGGSQTATGGMGGEAPAGDFSGMPFLDAGPGGDGVVAGGLGGNGFDDCIMMPYTPGGNGGKGGDGSATGGDGGTEGKNPGPGGEAILQTAAGNGGNGGDGVGPGTGGDGGAQSASDGQSAAPAAVVDDDPNYQRGGDGRLCVIIEGGPIDTEHHVGVTTCPQLLGTLTVTNPYDHDIVVFVTSLSPFLFIQPSGGQSIPAGDTAEFGVFFNCETTTSFEGIVRVSGVSEDNYNIILTDVPVSLNIISGGTREE